MVSRDGLATGPQDFIKIIKATEIKRPDVETGYEVGQNFLTAHQDVDAFFFGCNDLSALGCLKALEESGREGIVITGVDGQVEAVNAINQGTAFKCTGAQYPSVIGYVAAQKLLEHIAGKEVPPYIKIMCNAVNQPLTGEMAEQPQPWHIDPAKAAQEGKAISRVLNDVKYPLTEPVE